MEENRCKRTGSNWRCPKPTIPGKSYCEKHHLYCTNRRKNNPTIPKPKIVKCDSPSPSPNSNHTNVEPYRPVIDFETPELNGVCGGGNVGSFVDQGDIMGWLLDGVGGGGNDHFALFDIGSSDGFKTEVCDEKSGVKCGESNVGMLEMTGNCVGKSNVCLGEVVEGQIGETGCDENNEIVMGKEANSSLVGQKRKRATK